MKVAAFLALFLFLPFSAALAQEKMSASFLDSNYESSYAEQEYRLLGEINTKSFAQITSYLGYGHLKRRHYGSSEDFYKNSLLFGATWSPETSKMYYEFSGLFSDTGKIGAKSAFGLTVHSTHVVNWDFALGVDQAAFDTGDVTTVKPQALYFYKDFIFGHSSWIFQDGGSRYAWRNFVRLQRPESWQSEISIAGGDSREDVGVIDQFFSYGVSIRHSFKHFNLGVNAERYEGHLRSGYSWGISGTWIW